MKSAKNSYGDFINFCKVRDENAVLLLLEEGAYIDNSDENGIAALHVASAVGAEHILKLLLLKGAEVDKNTNFGWTPLMYAARNGHSKCIQQLIAYGADINHKNKFGVSVFSMATASGSEEPIEILLQAGHRELLSDSIISPFHVIALQGHCNVLQLLLGSQIHLINKCDNHGITPLMLAVAGDHEEVIKILLDYGADVNLQNSHQFTALDIASTRGYKKIIHLLEDKTEKGDGVQAEMIGSDLIEQYGWSSICTPKPRRITWHNETFKENILTSPTNRTSAEMSNILSQEMKDLSSLCTPVQLPLNDFSSIHTDTNIMCVPVPPVSPYNCSSPFNFHKTILPRKHHSLSSLNGKSSFQIQPGYSLLKEHNIKNDSLSPRTYPSHVQSNCNKINVKERSNGKLQRIRKLEKWFHTVLTPWQKKSNIKNKRSCYQSKTLCPQQNSQHSVNLIKEESPSSFQNNGKSANSDDFFSPTSTLKNLLINHKLQTYIPVFVEHEVDMDSFLMLRVEDLEEMGITSPRSRSKFLEVIMSLQGGS